MSTDILPLFPEKGDTEALQISYARGGGTTPSHIPHIDISRNTIPLVLE